MIYNYVNVQVTEMCSFEYTRIQDILFPFLSSDVQYILHQLRLIERGKDVIAARTARAVRNAIRNFEKEVVKCLEEM